MITQITKKEAAQIKAWHANGPSVIRCILFTAANGKEYKCDQVNPTGLKEIHAFKQRIKKELQQQTKLLEMESMLL